MEKNTTFKEKAESADMHVLNGIILAGGRSSRFGFNKLELKVENVPLFIDQVFKLSDFCSEILIVTSERNYPFIISELKQINEYVQYYPSIKLIPYKKIKVLNDDFFKNTPFVGAGPIMGLYTGLKNSSSTYSIVLAFDMPFISKNLIKTLILGPVEHYKDSKTGDGTGIEMTIDKYGAIKDARIIRTAKGLEVLCGLYSRNCIEVIKSNILKDNFKISGVFNEISIEIIYNDILTRENIDTLNFFNINNVEDYYRFTDIWKNKDVYFPVDVMAVSNPILQFVKKWESFYLR